MITNNIWVKYGICNGACGNIKHIIFAEGKKPPELPDFIVVEMGLLYSGPSFLTYDRYNF
jgi:hypothetical protein